MSVTRARASWSRAEGSIMAAKIETPKPGRAGSPLDEDTVRTAIALFIVLAMVAFFVWFWLTHLQQVN
jgi:hypothetical protein